ncbi:hypothetical protein KM043_002046 [Ampulex compressa]|nr:hypothetical protein KM043_002046 [Ampulex compressa]
MDRRKGRSIHAYTAFATPIEDGAPQQVTFIFRHGDRTPTETYPLDPHANYKWPGGWGALTKKGMRQMYDVGRWMREKYGSLIGNEYRAESVSVRSTYADRCIMSAQALLAGLFPPTPDEIFVPGLLWRPIPVHSTPRNLDKVIAVKAPCPRLDAELRQAYVNDSLSRDALPAEYYQKLSALAGQNTTTITDVEFLYNTLEIEEMNGLKLPEWTKEFYGPEMRRIAARSLAIFTSNALQQRLRGGPLVKEILENMRSAMGGNGKKAYLYSAHDITIVNVLRTMGFTNELLKPDYGAVLILELHSVNGGQQGEVRVSYLNSTEATEAHPMRIPECGSPCYLENLIDAWKDITPINWDAECAVSSA